VVLSDTDTNRFTRVLKYKYSIDYKIAETESQEPKLQVSESNERIVKRLHQPQKILSDEEVSELIIGYKSGLTIYQLAKQFGCHRTTVSQHLKSRGVEMRNRPLTEKQIDEVARLYESGLSCTKVGKIIGVDGETVHRRLRERGVVMRGAHESHS
jgi:DNA-binding CsgD family transcriptional regulator